MVIKPQSLVLGVECLWFGEDRDFDLLCIVMRKFDVFYLFTRFWTFRILFEFFLQQKKITTWETVMTTNHGTRYQFLGSTTTTIFNHHSTVSRFYLTDLWIVASNFFFCLIFFYSFRFKRPSKIPFDGFSPLILRLLFVSKITSYNLYSKY